METERQRESLERLGLTSHQTEVYLALLERGPLGAADLAAAADIPRTRVYEVTKALQEYGLVATTLDKPTRFMPLPIRQFVEHTRERLRAEDASLSQNLPELERLLPIVEHADAEEESEHPGGLTTLRGVRVVERKLAAILADADKEVLALLGPGVLGRLKGSLAAACAAGIHLRILHHVGPKDLHAAQRLVEAGGAVRHSPAPEHLTVFVIDGRDCLIAFPPPDPSRNRPVAGLWTDEPHFVQAQMAAFENGWSRGIQLRDRQNELERGETPRTTDLLRAGEDDPETNAQVFADAAHRTFEHADARLDIALPTIIDPAIDWDTICPRLEEVRSRLLVPLPKDEREEAIVGRLLAIAEVREAPPALHNQVLVVADGSECLIATLSGQGRGTSPRLESVIVSTERGLVSASQTHFDVNWASALDLQEAALSEEDDNEHWWFTSRRAEDALLWAREAVTSAVRTVAVHATPAIQDIVPALVRGISPDVRVEIVTEEEEFGALAIAVDDHLCLVVEDPQVRDHPRGGPRLQRVGQATFTNNPAALRAWTGTDAAGAPRRAFGRAPGGRSRSPS